MMTKKSESKRKRGRPETRVLKIDATPEEVAKAIFAAAKPPDPSKELRSLKSKRGLESLPYKTQLYPIVPENRT